MTRSCAVSVCIHFLYIFHIRHQCHIFFCSIYVFTIKSFITLVAKLIDICISISVLYPDRPSEAFNYWGGGYFGGKLGFMTIDHLSNHVLTALRLQEANAKGQETRTLFLVLVSDARCSTRFVHVPWGVLFALAVAFASSYPGVSYLCERTARKKK